MTNPKYWYQLLLTRLVVHVVCELRLRVHVTGPQPPGRPGCLPVFSRIHARVHLLDVNPPFLFPAQQIHYCFVPRIFGVLHGGVGVVVLCLNDGQPGAKGNRFCKRRQCCWPGLLLTTNDMSVVTTSGELPLRAIALVYVSKPVKMRTTDDDRWNIIVNGTSRLLKGGLTAPAGVCNTVKGLGHSTTIEVSWRRSAYLRLGAVLQQQSADLGVSGACSIVQGGTPVGRLGGGWVGASP